MTNKRSRLSKPVVLVSVALAALVGVAGFTVLSKTGSSDDRANESSVSAGNKSPTGASANPGEPSNGAGAPKSNADCSKADVASTLFTASPVDAANVKSVNSGKITGDARFLYVWNKPGAAVNIYAPADGTLFKIRHIVNPQGMTHRDYGIFFMSDCGFQYRFNHITDPRADIRATYPAGDLPSADNYDGGDRDIPSRVEPTTRIKVKAGELLGSTTGTPQAHNFDIAVGNSQNVALCMFGLYAEPLKTTLLNLLSPDKNGEPVPGTPCEIATSPGY